MRKTPTTDLGRVGIWSPALRADDAGRRSETADAARTIEELGYGTVWLGGSPGIAHALPLLAATTRLTVATGILSIWDHQPGDVARETARANAAHGGRFLLGLGVSHGARPRPPYTAMTEYLTALDEAPEPVPAGQRVLAALGPRMLRLARDRAAGAHPYFVTADYVARARAALGPDALLAPELKAVLDPDPERGRTIARGYLATYLALPNYTNNLRRLGFTQADFADGGSDRLIDATVAIGEPAAVAERVRGFLAAGADHVAVQVVTGEDRALAVPLDAYRALAAELAAELRG